MTAFFLDCNRIFKSSILALFDYSNVSGSIHIWTAEIFTKYYLRRRPSANNPSADKENILTPTASGRYGGTPQTIDRLARPFKCPGSAVPARQSEKPARKKRRVSYADADGSKEDGDVPWTNEERLALANRENNKFPVYKVKDKEQLFRRRFAVPLINKDAETYNRHRPAPTLGMRTGAIFIPKPLHDPCGEFAIVLYDPTIDAKPEPAKASDIKDSEEEKKPVLDTPIMHKSLADILGLRKKVDDHPKIPVVIDPKLAKVLRPHQVEGVKVIFANFSPGHYGNNLLTCQVSLPMYYRVNR